MVVMRVVKRIAERGRSVICTVRAQTNQRACRVRTHALLSYQPLTPDFFASSLVLSPQIHQPSAELFFLFDRLLLLKSGGSEVYFGPVGEEGVDLVTYFLTAPIADEYYRPTLPEQANPASWMLEVIGAGTAPKGKIAPYERVYRESALRRENMEQLDRLSHPKPGQSAPSFTHRYASTYLTQFSAVLGRLFRVYWRDVSYMLSRMGLICFLGVVFGLVWQDLNDSDEAGLTSKLSSIYVAVGFIGTLTTSNALPPIFRLRAVFYREQASHTYSSIFYTLGLFIVELPYLFVYALLFTVPFYHLVGFVNDGELFMRFTLTLYLIAILYTYLGQLIAAITPSVQVANMLAGFFITLFFLVR